MAKTDLTRIPVPDAFTHQVPRRSRDDLTKQAIQVDLDWWNNALDAREFSDRIDGTVSSSGGPRTTSGRGWITRADLSDRATGADNDPGLALDLLWRTLAWGAGTSARNMKRRLDSVAGRPDAIARALTEAAALARADVEAAYTTMRPGRQNLVPYLGPAFFSKYLYFAGEGRPQHPCLILDARVAAGLRRHGWNSLRTGGSWPSSTYRRYVELLARWAGEASTPGRLVAADELELWLFNAGGHSA